jgi:hypothetical protein
MLYYKMGIFGNLLGQGLGNLAGGLIGHSKEGQTIGGTLGGFLPFKNGGIVKRTGPAKLHAGELVVPKHLVKKVSKSLKKEIKKSGGRNM